MIFWANRIIILSSILLIFIGPAFGQIGTGFENIYDLIEENKIEVEATGSGISSLSLKIEPKVDINLKVYFKIILIFPCISNKRYQGNL